MRFGLHISPSLSSTSCVSLLCALLLGIHTLPTYAAITLNIDDDDSLKQAAKQAAAGMTSYYTGYRPGDVPGNLPQPYYWWEAGAMFDALIGYWFYTGDDQYNNITMQGLLHQTSPTNDFMPPNQTMTEGNDDQGFWGMAAMTAAERNFPNPPPGEPQWLALVQGVFNSQAARWDMQACNGGLKWQIFSWNNGFNYKNTISNGCFFNIASRLALYTNNQSYAHWAEKAWDWTTGVGLISDKYECFDGADIDKNCTNHNPVQFSYNLGVFLHGCANMFNLTNGDAKWKQRIDGFLQHLDYFFPKGNIMSEVSCEPVNTCETDSKSFKAYLARWLAATTQIAPYTADIIMPKLQASAQAAATACDGTKCGLKWTTGTFDGSTGVGEDMAALEIFQGNLAKNAKPPLSIKTGGTSKGAPGGGSTKGGQGSPAALKPITTADRAGAGILTAMMIGTILSGVYSIVT